MEISFKQNGYLQGWQQFTYISFFKKNEGKLGSEKKINCITIFRNKADCLWIYVDLSQFR